MSKFDGCWAITGMSHAEVSKHWDAALQQSAPKKEVSAAEIGRRSPEVAAQQKPHIFLDLCNAPWSWCCKDDAVTAWGASADRAWEAWRTEKDRL
jgi:hypothetical protein